MPHPRIRDRVTVVLRSVAPLQDPGVGALRVAALVLVMATGGAAYTVAAGDTLGSIAARFSTSVSALVSANDVADPDLIFVGQTLTIPGEPAPTSTPPRTGGAPDLGRTHVVGAGESLASIASRYGIPAEALARANGITDPDRILAGSLLRVAGEAPPPPGAPGTGPATHVVAPGETLSSIAGRYGASVAALVESNGLGDPDHIVVGQHLAVPGDTGTGWTCPVPGARFINDFGVGKPDGRFHEGVDLFAPTGTIIVAPVAGRVEHVQGARAGLQFTLHGDDGYTYIGTHLDAFGPAGRVGPGDPIGQVGSTGNARGAPPHLHLEMHYDGVVNPYPTLREACGR